MLSPWQHPPSVQTSKEGGRTSNPNRQCSRSSFLKGYTQRRRRRRAREGRVGCPRPSGDAPAAPSPPPAHPRPPPRERPGSPRSQSPGTRLHRPARPPAVRRGCVCARWGRGPARLPPSGPARRLPSTRRPTRRAAACPPTGWTAGCEGRRGVSGKARASGFLGVLASGSELTVPEERKS